MKFIAMRGAVALAVALSLASCGGGKATFTIGGTVENLKYAGLQLTTNGMDVTVNPAPTPANPPANVSYSFPKQLEYGDVYQVTVKKDPPHQSCLTLQKEETAGRLAQINVLFSCLDNNYTIGGTVAGLRSEGLVLANGSTARPVTVPKDATTFVFPDPVFYGKTFGVTVLASPADLVCSVSPNGTGTMDEAKVENIAVTCVPKS